MNFKLQLYLACAIDCENRSHNINTSQFIQVPTDALNGLKALNVLNLRCNRIQDLEESVFENVTSIMDINLSCNQVIIPN